MFGKFSKKNLNKFTHKVDPKTKRDHSSLINKSPEESITHIQSSLEQNSNFKKSKPATESKIEIQSFENSHAVDHNQDKSVRLIDDQISKTQNLAIESSIKADKSQLLLLEIEKLRDKTIKPSIDFNENCLTYPILSKVDKSPDDVSYLDELAADGTLKKETLEKLIICPIHRDAFSSSVRLYCPKCNSLKVEKLNLFEHKRCGFITENTEYDFSDPKNSACPSCNRKIVDFKKEIRIPAMWHQCVDCKEKFDNAIIKMYCREHEHDFDINSGQFVTTYSYKIKDYGAPLSSEDEKLREDLAQLLRDYNFSTEFKPMVKGKSGNPHKIPIFAKNNSNGETISVFIDNDSEKISQYDINSILVPILDIGPMHTLLLSFSDVEEDALPLAKKYGIQIMANSDLSQIINQVNEFASKNFSKSVKSNEK